jgi:hypothetical protein
MERDQFLEAKLPELSSLEQFLNEACVGRVETLESVPLPSKSNFRSIPLQDLPLYRITYGSNDPRSPVLVLVGGVHGLERIGTQVVNALLTSFNKLVQWDSHAQSVLKKVRVVFIPLLNPWGMALTQRSNANGIDLMRNAPIEAEGSTVPLLSGHRLGSLFPWYRGESTDPMELEAAALVKTMTEELAESRCALSLDVHSGFGFNDQLWFPYAKTTEPFHHLAEMMAIKQMLDATYPYHVYKVEPQAMNYVTHGDLWDYIYDKHRERTKSVYIPLCLEMGSWSWVRKNPRQVFRLGGIFDPILPHRRHRAFRRHHLLFDLMLRLLLNPSHWSQLAKGQKNLLRQQALELWKKDPQP